MDIAVSHTTLPFLAFLWLHPLHTFWNFQHSSLGLMFNWFESEVEEEKEKRRPKQELSFHAQMNNFALHRTVFYFILRFHGKFRNEWGFCLPIIIYEPVNDEDPQWATMTTYISFSGKTVRNVVNFSYRDWLDVVRCRAPFNYAEFKIHVNYAIGRAVEQRHMI